MRGTPSCAPVRTMREKGVTGYGPGMASDETGGRGIILVVAGIAVMLVILFVVLQYAR